MKKIWNHLVNETSYFFSSNNFERAVIGLSGGIDSALVASIAVAALDKYNVFGVMMPSPHSSAGSLIDAQKLCENLHIESTMIPIMDMNDVFTNDHNLSHIRRNKPFKKITRENLQARIRSVILMTICNELDALMLNTCNKSEDYTGYCTLYGDSCGAVAPIGDLYKTDVYRLARWINKHTRFQIPQASIDKEPSAELSSGQQDSDDLPPYDILDSILKMLYDEKKSVEHIIALGFPEVIIKRIQSLYKKSQFKRDQSPPVIRI